MYSLCFGDDEGVLELKNQNGFFQLKPCSVLKLPVQSPKILHAVRGVMCPLPRNTLEQAANVHICSKQAAQSSGGNLSVKKLLWKLFN